MRNLAYIGIIVKLTPIAGANSVELAEVTANGGVWRGIVKINEYTIGDLCEIYLQDAVVPQTDRFAFMARRHFIVKMMKVLGVPSECLIMPLTVDGNIGDDVTEELGVSKYEKPMPNSMRGMPGVVLDSFPSYVPRTDEPNMQSVPWMLYALKGKKFVATQKCDGMSATYVMTERDGFLVCSRNYSIPRANGHELWLLAKKYDLENRIPKGYAIQLEVVGPGIQKNPMGLTNVEPRCFNVFEVGKGKYLDHVMAKYICQRIAGIPFVETVEHGEEFDLTKDQLIELADRRKYPSGKSQEGIVVRPMVEEIVNGQRLSFKVINLNYKD